MIERVKGFEPIVDSESKVLILGSMPGLYSLQLGEYYAHKQNAFWKILNKIFPESTMDTYDEKIAILRLNKIAIWDVLRACERKGSLDDNIALKTIEVNDFSIFFERHPQIEKVLFNGAFAEKSYKRFVLESLTFPVSCYMRLPSTSPAHASLSFDEKFTFWKKALTPE